MELTIDDKKMREIMKDVIIEMLKENREGFCNLNGEYLMHLSCNIHRNPLRAKRSLASAFEYCKL
ncbi:MAG: hypothetical protein E3K36_09675 [Candidatus Brocadia sp.]|nr:hypothetical protein [Candidatus Brocadia sp.]